MVREEVLTKTREFVNQIYEKMNVIESCDTLAEKVKDLDVCFNDTDKVIALNEVLRPVQLTEIREGIISKIYDNATEAQSFLERLNRKPAIINPEFEQAVKEMEAQPKPSIGRKKIELDIEQVKDLYINKGLSFRKVAAEIGCAENTIRNFAIKHGVTREAAQEDKPAYPEMTIDAVRKVYTQGKMNLADTANHFGVGSGELYNFIEKNNLKRKIVKSNDPFLDSNKMGKEEFKRQMLAGRK